MRRDVATINVVAGSHPVEQTDATPGYIGSNEACEHTPDAGDDLEELAACCAEETDRFLHGLPSSGRYGFALFHHALVIREDRAWSAIYECYGELVRKWARHATADTDAVESLVAEAFARLWLAVDATKFGRFPDLRSLLRYLKLCVLAAEIDRRRDAARHALEVALEASGVPEGDTGVASIGDAEQVVLDDAGRHEFWRVVQCHVHDRRQYLLLRLSFVEGLPPREICRRAPEQFPTVHDVYRVKRNVLDHLRRSPAVRQLGTY